MRRAIPTLAAALLWSTPVSAQDAARDEAQRAAREGAASGRAAESADASQLLPPLADAPVSYAQVLERPDDVRLNYLWAQTQLRRGDLRGAAATLERILLLRPDLSRVRLLYGVVLYRLDDLVEAERELRAVSALALSAPQRAQVDAYLEEIRLRTRRTRLGLSVSAGAEYDSNRNAGPRSDDLLAFDFRLPADSGSREEDDFSFVGLVGLDVERDLESQAGHRLLGSFEFFAQEQDQVSELDLRAFTWTGGALLRTPLFDLRPRALASVLLLEDELFLGRYGGGLELRRALPWLRRLELAGDLSLAWEDYDDTDRSPALAGRTGLRLDARVGGDYRLSPRDLLGVSFAMIDKWARRNYYAYRGIYALLEYRRLLGRGQFVALNSSYGYDWYRDNDAFVSARRRRDKRWRSRLSYGLPLGQVLGGSEGPAYLSDVLLTLTGEYFRSSSNLTNYSYDNWRGSLLFTKRLRF